jgi:hypothetical protein
MTPRSPVTLSAENGLSRIRPSLDSCPAANAGQRPAQASRRPFPLPTGLRLVPLVGSEALMGSVSWRKRDNRYLDHSTSPDPDRFTCRHDDRSSAREE